ncbi:helix-turn-helix transcriptional regulator [Actinoplanes sp. TBRC 11911]|uniref:helix-turn-helix domain-containing protein n=1 Tax=Actinoplanes sp. TBRC 11911 TaxID=2729386 RepID=UPI00145DECE3|nr:helix-turn-helix transcriptional regulator [Actinoplanes sp. TBRC 11911]NMO57101.1 helix-turn-helix transcriptional regulator [Actinoplanes sp. TBRC 11911]
MGPTDVGARLRDWRTTRRMSQLELAVQAGVSARHLSFLETGRSRPTREMILRLAGELAVPMRSQNELLLAGGYAPAHPESDLGAAPLAAVLSSLRDVLAGHAPYPAVLIDRHWTMVDANDAVAPLTQGCAAWLLEPPVNVLRLSLHPEGMAPRIGNLAEWRTHVLDRLDRQAATTADPVLRELYRELAGYPGGTVDGAPGSGLVVPLRFENLTFFSITSVLGTPLDVTLSELAIESFLPADARTAAALHAT